jgi:YbgC/YbaW family acyl-CoA thioester hydrolase
MTAQPFRIDERVRWSDVDAAGIIFYGSYVRFFELAETELFRAAGLTYGSIFDEYDMLLPRALVHAEFHHPARLDDVLQVAAYVSRVGNKSITMQFDVMLLGADRLTAEGHLVLVSTDRARLESRVLPETFVRHLEPFTLSIDEARRQLGWVGSDR